MTSNTFEQAELLASVAHLYFETGDDQATIARRLRVSRSSISRLLTQARQQGIVEIRIRYPLPTADDISEALKARFGLREAHVLATEDIDVGEVQQRVSVLAAKVLDEKLRDGDTLALSWGTMLHAVAQNVHPTLRVAVRVVQLVGTLSAANLEIDGGNLVRQFATALHAQYYNLHAPLMVESVDTARALAQEPSIRAVLELAHDAAIALVGIGAVAHGASSAVRAKVLSRALLATIRQQQAVGDICSRYFDLQGNPVANAVNERVIGLELEALKAIPLVIGVASGQHKSKAILGALHGGFVNVLITDDATARRVLHLDTQFSVTNHTAKRS